VVADRASWHVPPAKTLFVQRKISGTALLCVRMRARLPLVALAARHSGTALATDPQTVD
jgi:prolyl-tRNA editing enzyme YbaK/EbsC (Cys-tRNA(Pro) deacylase)